MHETGLTGQDDIAVISKSWHAKRMRLRLAYLFLALGLSIVPEASGSRDYRTMCPSDVNLARLLAGSDVVLVGKMEVSEQHFMEEAQKPSPDYLNIPIQIESVIKGSRKERATLRFYPRDTAYKPSNDAVLGLAGASAIFYLTQVDEGPVGLYFAGYTPDALKMATDLTVEATRAEAFRQEQIISSWRPDKTQPFFGEVRSLVSRLGRVGGGKQQRVFDRLEALGNAAVPAIIAQMDDRRPLRTQAIALVNHAPDAFEGVRHYGPEQVVDGLAALLNQITGESFGEISNGGSTRERDAAVAGWRVYAADLACKSGK